MRKNKDEEIKEAYFKWLCDLVAIGGPGQSHPDLLELLSKKEFYWSVPNDDNREKDGLQLREQFADEELKEDCPCLDGPCSMLEMLIALSKHMDFQLWENRQVGERVGRWFWEMVERLELEGFEDEDDFEDRELKVMWNNQRLDTFLNRTYSRRGHGGLFPLSGRPINGRRMPDQRKTELWYQLNYYIIENYND